MALLSELEVLKELHRTLSVRRSELMAEINQIDKQLQPIRLQEDRLTYTCTCVRLNSEIDVYDCAIQDVIGREGLGCGLVANSLSALRACPICHGSGKPEQPRTSK